MNENAILLRISRLISLLLHPFILPCYVMLILLHSNTSILLLFPVRMKMLLMMIVATNTLLIPSMFILMMHTVGYMKVLLPKLKYLIGILTVASCYVMGAYMLPEVFVAFSIHKFFIVGAVCAMFALVYSFFQPISLHMVVMGGVLSLLIWMQLSSMGEFMSVIIVTMLLAGVLASARLYMGENNLSQVALGFCGGAIVSALTLIMF